MATREEIEEGQRSIYTRLLENVEHINSPGELSFHIDWAVNESMSMLHSQGLVIEVEGESMASICAYCEHLDSCLEEHSECDKFKLEATYVKVEPLIEGG